MFDLADDNTVAPPDAIVIDGIEVAANLDQYLGDMDVWREKYYERQAALGRPPPMTSYGLSPEEWEQQYREVITPGGLVEVPPLYGENLSPEEWEQRVAEITEIIPPLTAPGGQPELPVTQSPDMVAFEAPQSDSMSDLLGAALILIG